MGEAVVVDAVRTPSGRGRAGGALAGVHPVDLLAGVIEALVARTGVDPAAIDDVYAGCVGQAGEQAFNVGRNAALAAGLPESVPAVTVDRQCGSGQQAAHFAAQAVRAGDAELVIACGVESMSRVPLGSSAQGADVHGARFADRYPDGLVPQGVSAELLAAEYGLDRAALDAFSARSHALAAAAADRGDFAGDLVPVRTGDGTVAADETIRRDTTAAALADLPPAFRTDALAARFPQIDWRITAGSASPLTDGASAVLVAGADAAARLGLRVRARLGALAAVGSDPLTMLDGVVPATRAVLARSGRSIRDFTAFEVNEAFAPVPLLWREEFGADPEKLNAWGGAIALGHALGSTGTRLLGTLVARLEASGGGLGLQAVCEGGGMANALVVECP